LSTDEQRTLDMITTPVRYPPPSLQVSETQTAVTFTDAEGRTRSFQTNGKREPQSFDSARVESSARREGPQLVIDFDLGKGRKMTYTYFVVPTSQQLLLRITFERAPKEPGPFEVKYVYARAATVP
jgi:hypothetical protein